MMNNRLSFISLATIAILAQLGGCVPMSSTTEKGSPRNSVRTDYAPPICMGKEDCDVKWAKAMETIQYVTKMRLRLVTDQYLETYVGTRIPGMIGRVSKVAQGDGRYEIRAVIECTTGSRTCGNLPDTALQIFNFDVTGIKEISKRR